MAGSVLCQTVAFVFFFFAETESGGSGQTTAIGAIIAGFALMTGLMGWVIKHMLDTTIPDLSKTFQNTAEQRNVVFIESSKQFQATLVTVQEGFRSDIRELAKVYTDSELVQRETFRSVLENQRKFFAEQLKGIVEGNRAERETTTADIKMMHDKFFDIIVSGSGLDKGQKVRMGKEGNL